MPPPPATGNLDKFLFAFLGANLLGGFAYYLSESGKRAAKEQELFERVERAKEELASR